MTEFNPENISLMIKLVQWMCALLGGLFLYIAVCSFKVGQFLAKFQALQDSKPVPNDTCRERMSALEGRVKRIEAG